MTEVLLFSQLIAFFTAVLFAAGGGNYPGLSASAFIYIKGALLAYPILMIMIRVMIRPDLFYKLGQILRQNKWLLLYIFIIFLSVPLGVDPGYSLNRVLYTVFSLVSLMAVTVQYLIYKASSKIEVLTRHLNGLTLGLIVYILISTAQHGFDIGQFRNAIQENGMLHPNMLSSFCVHLIVWHLAVFFLASGQPFHKLIPAFFIAILGLVIGLLFSRTAMLSLLTVMCIGPLVYGLLYRRLNPMLVSGGILFISLTAAVLVLTDILPQENVLNIIARNGDTNAVFSITNRLYLWQDILDSVTFKVFLIGNGYAVMTEEFGKDFGTGILYGAHNAYLSIFLGSGVFAVMVMLFYLATKFIKIVQSRFLTARAFIWAASCSYFVFLTNCLTAEEMGINISVTFAYVIFLSLMVTGSGHDSLADRV